MPHSYPKNRKPNENSITQILLKKYTEKELYKMWLKFNGMYKMSDYLTHEMGFYVSPKSGLNIVIKLFFIFLRKKSFRNFLWNFLQSLLRQKSRAVAHRRLLDFYGPSFDCYS
jgi:hypothetical protein